jgi:excisionase family DNA binding protein
MARRSYFRTAVARREPDVTVPDDGQPLLTLEQACDFLQVSKRALYRLVEKDLPYRKVGGRLRFHRGELDAWTRRHRVGPALSSTDVLRMVR